jgi:hypothetical protein
MRSARFSCSARRTSSARSLAFALLAIAIAVATSGDARAASRDAQRNAERRVAATALIRHLEGWVKEHRCYPVVTPGAIVCPDAGSSGAGEILSIDGGTAFAAVLGLTHHDPSTGLAFTQVNVDPNSRPAESIATSALAVGAGRKCNKDGSWVVRTSSPRDLAVLYRLEPLTPVKYGCVVGKLDSVATPASPAPGARANSR